MKNLIILLFCALLSFNALADNALISSDNSSNVAPALNFTNASNTFTGSFTGSGAGLTNCNINVLNQSVLVAPAVNQRNIWFVLNQWTNSANLDFVVAAYTNVNITGISNTYPGFQFAVTIQQASTITTNLLTVVTNATTQFRPLVFGQILTMPTNSTASGMTLYFRSTGTNSAMIVGQSPFQ